MDDDVCPVAGCRSVFRTGNSRDASTKKNGDKNVYFIDGSKFMQGYAADAWCVDGTHPNDFGFVLMAKAMEKVLKPLL